MGRGPEQGSWPRLRRKLKDDWDSLLGWALLTVLLAAMLISWFWLNPLYMK